MTLKGYQIVPYPLGTPEWESFKNYARTYYKDAILLVDDTMKILNLKFSESGTREYYLRIFQSLVNATISPLVFLWEKWQLMSLDDKLKYATPEYKKQLDKIKAESQKVKDAVKDEKWAESNRGGEKNT